MRRRPSVAWLASVLFTLGTGCTKDAAAPRVADVTGAWHTPTHPIGDAVHVVVFTSQECPIANSYAPTLAKLQEAWRSEPRVRLFLVHVDPDLTVADARRHAAEYALPGAVLLDPTHAAVRASGASITPEAVVWSAGEVVYRGRIDDQWRKLGSRAPAASTNDLRDAVALALRGEPTPLPHPPAVGCLLPEPGV